jgi:hypothetical protein
MTDFSFEHILNFNNSKINKQDVKNALEEANLEEKTLSSIHKILSKNVPENILKKIHTLTNKNEIIITKIKNKLNDITNDDYITDNIIEKIYYLENLNLETVKLELDLKEELLKFEFPNNDFYDMLYNSKEKNIGRGEILLSWLLSGKLVNSKEKGDILLDDLKYEVKAENGRLCGQNGFGNGHDVAKSWYEDIKILLNDLNFFQNVKNAPTSTLTNNYITCNASLTTKNFNS